MSPGTADLVDERIREADAAPMEGRPWEDVEAELRAPTAVTFSVMIRATAQRDIENAQDWYGDRTL